MHYRALDSRPLSRSLSAISLQDTRGLSVCLSDWLTDHRGRKRNLHYLLILLRVGTGIIKPASPQLPTPATTPGKARRHRSKLLAGSYSYYCSTTNPPTHQPTYHVAGPTVLKPPGSIEFA